jgi:hypothetical protein
LPLEEILHTLQAQRAHLAEVIDEYGGTAGPLASKVGRQPGDHDQSSRHQGPGMPVDVTRADETYPRDLGYKPGV